MLYTDTDSFLLYFFVDDLSKEINARPHLRDAFDFSEIHPGYLSNLGRAGAELHTGEVGYCKDETKGDPIVEFVGLRPTIYSFTVCRAAEPIPALNLSMDMWHKAVGNGVARSYIKRFKPEDYVRMYNGEILTNVVNRRIGSKLHRVGLTIFYLIINDRTQDFCF